MKNNININNSIYKNQISKVFNYTSNWDLLDAVAEIVENVMDDINGGCQDIYTAIYEEMDRVMTTNLQWIIMEWYQSPEEANYNKAYEDFSITISVIIDRIQEGKN